MPLNSITIIGNVGKDPEVKFPSEPGKKAVAKFTVAVNDKRGGEETVEWFNVVAFDKTAEICGQYLQKGREVCVQGKMQTRKYEKDGRDQYWVELVANNVVLLSNGGKGARDEGPAQGLGGVPRESAPF
jgi:single-strand DNA-binding protein